ncbi:MAG: transglutaminase-like domain-containing protein [Bacteroidales bacterium]|nr:transglutaminase-like domain-containing protein [Clostridium sp.]MCM1204184.1 transglutaminase-like domain-containing protein [Bacteroidales bacterium]
MAMLFKKKKKEEVHKGDIFLAKGIYLKQPVLHNGNTIVNCFLRSLIVFFLVLGSIGGFLSAFEISYNFVMVVVAYLALSMYFAFLYASSKLLYRDLGYILFFAVFVVSIYVLQPYANSGFYTIVNAVLRRAQMFFNLSGVREYEAAINNDYLTVAVAVIFVGMVIIIVLNIWIYSAMSLFWTGLLTFPLLLIPLYMKITPDAFYLIVLGVGYAAVVIFKANGHYLAFAWDASFRVKGLKKNQVSYTQDAGIFRQILTSLLVLGFCVVIIVESIIPPAYFDTWFKSDRLREETSDAIGNFVLLGFAGLYNHYASTGGMSGGKLGGISNVRPDYQPDLIVSYVPYSNEAVYLKGYTGGRYNKNQWESLYENADGEAGGIGMDDIAVFQEESMEREADFLRTERMSGGEYSASGQMDVKNVGADTAYLYYPYYTYFDDYTIYNNHGLLSSAQGIGMQQEASYNFYPKIVWEDSLGEVLAEQISTEEVAEVFLEVPDANKEVLEAECAKIGLSSNMTENEIVDAVVQYFQDNIPYTLKPGATPSDEDVVNYFLTKNRKGYCAHFASAATLLFRQMGIPARYVEGYAFSFETVLASEINNGKQASGYYHGYSRIGEAPVMDVEVTDAMAHAWVEIYIEDFGWRLVEVTPSSNEAVDEDDFWSAFTDFFNNINGDGGDDGGGFGGVKLSEYTWLINVVLGIISFILLVMLLKLMLRKIRRYRSCHQENEGEAVIACYADICDMLRLCYTGFNLCRSHREQLDFIGEQYGIDFNREEMCKRLERLSFSASGLSGEELKTLREQIAVMRKCIWKQASVKEKIGLCKR